MKGLSSLLMRVVAMVDGYYGGGDYYGGEYDMVQESAGGFNTAMIIEWLKIAGIAVGIILGSLLVGHIVGKVIARIAYPAQASVYSLPEKIVFYSLMLLSVAAIIASVIYFLWPV